MIDLPEPLRNMAVVLAAVAAATGPSDGGGGLAGAGDGGGALPVVECDCGAMGLLLSPGGFGGGRFGGAGGGWLAD